MRRVAVLFCFVALTGCGATTKVGGVGDTLSSRTLRATLEKVVPRVPVRHRHDVTGLGVPAAGQRFVGARMKLCRTESGPALNAYAFTLTAGGATVHGLTPNTVYSDAFDVSRDGCEEGWLLFSVPEAARAMRLALRYDDTGSNEPGQQRPEHARFSWTL